MKTAQPISKTFVNRLPGIVFFVLGAAWLYYFSSYIFFYQEKSSLFVLGAPFLKEHLQTPGGFLTYLGLLQSSFYFYPLLGAVLVMFELCTIVFVMKKIAERLANRPLVFLPFLLGAMLFFMQSHYQYAALNHPGILIQLVLFYVTLQLPEKMGKWLAVVLFPANYFLFGSFAVLYFMLFTVFSIVQKKWLPLVALWVVGVMFFWVGREFLFFQTTYSLLIEPFSVEAIGGQTVLFGATLAGVAFVPLWALFGGINKKWMPYSPWAVLLVLAVVLVTRIDKKNSHYFYVEKLFYEQKYDELNRFNSTFPTNNLLSGFLNNVALAERGRLTEELFRFRQAPDGGTLFLKWELLSEVLKRGGYFYYSIGMINEAQRWAYEYMVMHGYTPEGLKMLIKTDLIKGKYKTAEKYISILEKTIFYRKQALAYRKFLNADEAVAADPELGKKQQLDTKADFFVQSDKPYLNLDFILASDSTNIPAMEYKLAWLMLKKDMKSIVRMLPMLENAGYTHFPKNVEEVVVAYQLLNAGQMPELKRLKIKPQTVQRFQQFYRTFEQNRGNKQQAQKALAKNFADTYWYYVFFF